MNYPSSPFFRVPVCLLGLGLLLAGPHGNVHAAIDSEMTRQVWKLKFGVTDAQLGDPVWMAQDADHDGSLNADEMAVGTNPFSPTAVIDFSRVQRNGASMEIHFPTETGKRYQVESNTTLSPGGWVLQPQPNPVAVTGDGSDKMLSIVMPPHRMFCRVRVDEIDTDNDRLSDWVEGAVALNPGLVQSATGVNDYDYVAAQISLPDTVSIRADSPFASEDGPLAGMLSVVRPRKLFPITVNYTASGTAVAEADYAALPGTVVLPAGVDQVSISVNPIPASSLKGSLKGSRSVTATLTPPAGSTPPVYRLGAQDKATVIIQESEVPSGTGLLARYYDTGSGTYADPLNFGQTGSYSYTRNTTTAGTITITGNHLGAQSFSALQPGHLVRLAFTSGNLNNVAYNNQIYTVTGGVTATTFNVAIAGTSLPNNSPGNCNLSIQSFPHPAVVERLDATINHDWLLGTPNGVTLSPNNQSDNYSAVWEGYLSPGTAGNYTFQLDADDKARVLLDTGTGLVQILEHGWDGPATIGTFKQSAAIPLAVPPTPAQRYRIRVEHCEAAGDARCRLQWRAGSAAFANISPANVFSHTRALTYSYTQTNSTSGTVMITPSGGHSLAIGNTVNLSFSTGNLFTPGATTTFNRNYNIAAVNGTTSYTVALTGTSLPVSGTGAGFVLDVPASATTGLYNQSYQNTTFANSPARIAVDSSVTGGNNGFWGSGSPSPLLIQHDSFSARWTGQVQPQFSEEYTFVTNVDDNVSLRINGQVQELRLATASTVGGTYAYSSATGNLVVTHPLIPAGSFVVGEIARVYPTSGNLNALKMADYPITAVSGNTFTVSLPAGAYPNGSSGNISIEAVNKPLTDFAFLTTERFVRIPMVGGVRYDIQLDYFEGSSFARCQLFWFSPSQTRQIIPSQRLYPSSLPQAPAALLSETAATALVGGPFSFPVMGSNGSALSISGNPAWLTFSGGVLGGTPPAGAGGDYQILITATNSAGSSTSVLNLHVEDTGSSISRDYWTGLPGTSLAGIPTGTTPAGATNLTSLEAPTDFGDNYGARIRGYLTAPTTGNYYFWLAASNAAELWISNDEDPINAFKRAWVNTGSTTPRSWTAEPDRQSPWLALEQGKRYYIEILHKAGTGAGDNLAVGWLKPGDPGNLPTEVVPGYALSPYIAPAAGSTPGTLYVSTLLAQDGAVTSGVGTSSLRLSGDGNSAIMSYTHNGLTGPIVSQHIHTDPYLNKPSTIVYDIDTPVTPGDGLQPDGTHKWTILPVGTLSKADIVEIIKQGKAYINLHTALYPAGEIRGNYTLANGSRTFTPPPAPPSWTDDHVTDGGASRFLTQTTFGANPADITALKGMANYEAWIDDQFTKPATRHLPEVLARELADVFNPFDTKLTFNTWWRNSITAPDQLRQRIAFALSEIHVVSGQGPLVGNSRALSDFYDTLLDNAFGNFLDILVDTTLTPGMGRYLDMLRNDKPDLAVGRIPNENYAREIKQLFSIGLYRMWPDGTLMLSAKNTPIDTYSQREIVGFSHVFTGWDYGYDGAMRTTLGATTDWTRPMREVPGRHFTGPKRVLNNEVLPGLPVLAGQPLDPFATHNSTHFTHPAYQALPRQELDAAHDQLFNHPNTGPFICRQLIQRLVTSHPSRDYLYRVVGKFNDNGSGVRGDMKSVIKAILLDYEARSSTAAGLPAFGKQREPVLRVAAAARAFRPADVSGTYSQNGSNLITITTTTPHLMVAGNTVFLEFTDTTADPLKPAPSSGIYTVVSRLSNTSYTINAHGWITGTYNQSGNTITVNLSGHWLPTGGKAWIDFTSGPADGVAGLDNSVNSAVTSNSVDFASGAENVSGTTFTITSPNSATTTNSTLMISRFNGSYFAYGGIFTIDTAPGGTGTYGAMADHHLAAGDNVFLNFTNSRDTTSGNPTSTGNDLVYPVATIPDSNTFTVVSNGAANAAIGLDNQVYVFPQQSQPRVRNGTVNTRPSTFRMDNTDTDLDQTPLNSPTVFNFFLPDYKFAGTLASQGLTTPEFQSTAETTVVRQSQFIFNALFNPTFAGSINGSFVSGSNALVLDFSLWTGLATDGGLGAGPQPTQVWTSNANLGALMDRLNTLLLAGQWPTAAKTATLNFLHRPISGISTGDPCTITSNAHGLTTGDAVTITGVSGGTFTSSINNASLTVTITGANTFTVARNCTAAPNAAGLAGAHFSPVAYDNAAPTTDQIRNRLRAVLHFILTSPDYTIQR